MNKKENSENLVKKMLLSISMVSCFAVTAVDNVNTMKPNSIFGQISGDKSDNSQQNTTPVAAPVSVTPNNSTPANYRGAMPVAGSDLLILDKNIKVDSKIMVDTKEKSGKDKNESSKSDSSDSSSLSFDETMNVSFSLTVPEPTKEALASSKVINAKKDKDVLSFLNSMASMNDIPLCMYNVLISRIDDFFNKRIPLNDKVIRTILHIWGVDYKILSEPEDSIPIILQSIHEILSEVLLRR